MKKYLFFLSIALVSISCQKDKTITEELVGNWVYERETFNSFSTFEDPDTEGFINLNADETGEWTPSNNILNFDLEWDLQDQDQKIAITKSIELVDNTILSTTVYDITRKSEDEFMFRFHQKFESQIDSIEDFEMFENIILTRL